MTPSPIVVLDANEARELIAAEIARALAPLAATLAERAPVSPPAGSQGLLSRHDLATLLSIDARTVQRRVKDGSLPPPVRLGSRTIRWRPQDVQAWLDRQAKTAS